MRTPKSTLKTNWLRSLAVTVCLILLVAAGSFLMTGWINQREEQNAFQQLYQEAGELVHEVESRMQADREQLEMAAAMVAEFEDPASPELWALLDSYHSMGTLSRLELLLPDGRVLGSGGQPVQSSGSLSFADATALGAHITDRELDPAQEGSYILRHYVPVIRDGTTVAMLCGVIELGSLPEELLEGSYGGQAAVYIIDSATGDFLLDTWHNEQGGNIWALGERPLAPGYDHEHLQQGLVDGASAYVVFVSNTTGEYLYFYYTPISINAWRLALSVPEDTVFADAHAIRRTLNIFLLFEGIAFILYFIWMVRYVRRETSEKQRQLDNLNYINHVEKLLFSAHIQQDNIALALKEVARILSAQQVVFWMFRQSEEPAAYTWDAEGAQRPAAVPPRVLPAYFQAGHDHFEGYHPQDLAALPGLAAPPEAKSLAAVPVEDVDGTLQGVLAAVNLPSRPSNTALLRSAGFSFSMLCRNMRTFRAVQAQGERDVLSGLYNRNRYEQDLKDLPASFHTCLACVYLDVNGLHELNNTRGHEAGDQMIRAVAEEIRAVFSSGRSYRIGGDEFLVFVPDMPQDEVERLGERLEQELARRDIHLSVGIQWQSQVPLVHGFIKAAEQKMYQAKRAYYEQAGHDRRRRPRTPGPGHSG